MEYIIGLVTLVVEYYTCSGVYHRVSDTSGGVFIILVVEYIIGLLTLVVEYYTCSGVYHRVSDTSGGVLYL